MYRVLYIFLRVYLHNPPPSKLDLTTAIYLFTKNLKKLCDIIKVLHFVQAGLKRGQVVEN